MDGMALFPQSYSMIAGWRASQGYDVYIVHYFDRTGTTFADPITTLLNYGTWAQTINDGVSWVTTRPTTNPNSIGFMGFLSGHF